MLVSGVKAMDAVDRKILTIINRSLPIDEQPFSDVAEETGLSQEEILERIGKLKEKGIIRRIGAVINPRGLGWHSTLCAVSIPEQRIEEYATIVNAFPEVTHNYARSGEPNCWFTLITPCQERSMEIIREIETNLHEKILDLPAKRTFKIKVSFDLDTDHDTSGQDLE
jgi:siroheme decarboxylase